ncbi:dTMP kinase [Symbiobacterium terraclitae]|uniref:Thymidylate kinase n=1 Tax=Symbiobacterium terraclitae TaxID=557451 RepID=A0ABS4JY72_9FIRM|nr:dTMP kinase [Symbiobacterium terraclitae]
MSVFITFEGVDGSGKSTQLRLLLAYLTECGIPHVFTREPGGTPIAEQIREVLLSPRNRGMSVITEALLFAAGRAEHVSRTIRPALEAGKVVICDRYVDSSLVYQGVAGGLPLEFLEQINQMATGALRPHRTIVLDLAPDAAMARLKAGGMDRIEEKALEYHELVRQGYLELARAEPRRVKVVDASRSVEEVQAQIRTLVDEVLPRRFVGERSTS